MRLASLAIIALFLEAVPASAADVPDMVGTWKPEAHSAARQGLVDKEAAAAGIQMDAPELTTSVPSSAPSLRIDAQNGGAFKGVSLGADGKPQTVLGAFRRDGKSFVISNATSVGMGEVDGTAIEICFTDAAAHAITAACTVYRKSP